MNKKHAVIILLILTGCAKTADVGIEKDTNDSSNPLLEKQTTSPFILKAAQGYVNTNNYSTPHTYLVDTYRDEVYVDTYHEPSGLTPEEIIENADKQEAVESVHPIFEIDALTVEEDSFSLEYDAELVEFTALSDSYYEDQEGIRYILESHAGIDQYIESLFE